MRERNPGRGHRSDHFHRSLDRFRPSVEAMEERRMLSGGAASAAATALTNPNWYYVQSLNGTLDHGMLSSAQVTSLTRMLDRGATHQQVVNRMLRLPTTLKTQVTTPYQRLLGRAPTGHEMAAGLALLRSGHDERAVLLSVLSSRDYYARAGGTHAAFMSAIYQQLLGRDPSASEATAGQALLAAGSSRLTVASRLLYSPESLSVFADRFQALPLQAPGGPDLGTTEALLRRPGGVRTTMAKLFSSDAYYQLVSTVPTRVPPAPIATANQGVNAHPAGLPLGQQWDLGTRWTLQSQTPVGLVVTAIATASDGTVWEGVESPSNLSTVTVYNARTASGSSYSSFPGTIKSIAAISPTEAWLITSQGLGYRITVNNGQSLVGVLPPLPNGQGFQQISAGSDGTIWVLSAFGNEYAYSSATNSWTMQPNLLDGIPNIAISVGSASNIWAVGGAVGSGPQVAMHRLQGYFQVDEYFRSKGGVTSISATSDGAAWAVAGNGELYLWTPETGAWHPVTDQSLPGPLSAISGLSRYRINAIDTTTVSGNPSTSSLYLLTYGVSDQPATGFPALTPEERIAYTYISQKVLETSDPNASIRSYYDDSLFRNQIPGWSGQISELGLNAPPAGVSSAVWSSITSQLSNETKDVASVITLITQANVFVQAVESASAPLLDAAANLVGLSTGQQNNTGFALFAEAMFEAAVAGIAAGTTGGAAIAAAVVSSGVNSAVADLSNVPNPDYTTAIQTTVAGLDIQLSQLYLNAMAANNSYEDAILSDYGRFKVVGDAVRNMTLAWDYSQNTTFANSAVNGFNQYFYQTLMPIRWDVVAFNGSFYDYIYSYIPSYDVYFLSASFSKRYPDFFLNYGNFRFINDRNGLTRIFNYPGPLPTSALLSEIYSTGTTRQDLFTGSNGWLQVVWTH